MKIRIALLSDCLSPLALLSLVACLLAAPVARAGLTVDIHLYHFNQGYYFISWLSTDATPPDFPMGDYLIASPTFPANGTWMHYQATNNDINLTSIDNDTIYPDLISTLNAITNELWSIWVTNSTSTNQYQFQVTASTLTSNSFGDFASISYPVNNALYVTNLPDFTWSGPTNWAGYLVPSVYFVDTNDNYNYVTSSSLSPNATNWTPSLPLPNGTNSFELDYGSNVTAFIVASTPTNNAAQAISGWVSTANVQTFDSVLFVIGQPPGSASLGHTNVAYYSFEDDNLFAHDSSGNGNDINSYSNFGDATNVPYMTNDAAAGSYAVGYTGAGWQDPPTNLVATLADSFSVSLWARTSDNPGNNSDTANSGAGLLAANYDQVIPMALTGSKLAFLTGGGTPDTLHSATSVNTGSYVHLVVTRDAGTGEKKIYVNGTLDASDFGATGQLSTGSDPALDLGMNTTFAHGFKGNMDEVQIYSGVLSGSDVAFLYNHPGTNVADSTGLGQTNIVLNGGFETGDFTGWTVTGGGNFVDDGSSAGITPHTGIYVAEFGAVGEVDYLSQTLSTTPGASYLLSFWLNSPDGETPNEFLVSWNGTVLFDETDLPAFGWTNIQFVVTATNTSMVLQFGGQDDPTYLALDDVSVVPTQAAPSPVQLINPQNTGANFQFQFQSQTGFTHDILYRTNIVSGDWLTYSNVIGDGTLKNIAIPFSVFGPSGQGFIRVSTQ